MHKYQLLMQAFMIVISRSERRRESFRNIYRIGKSMTNLTNLHSDKVKLNIFTQSLMHVVFYVVIADGERIPY